MDPALLGGSRVPDGDGRKVPSAGVADEGRPDRGDARKELPAIFLMLSVSLFHAWGLTIDIATRVPRLLTVTERGTPGNFGRDLWHAACRFVNRGPGFSDTSLSMGEPQIYSLTSHALTSADSTPLRADFYLPAATEATAERGLVVLLHGYCEHRGRYRHVAEHLIRHGYTVLVGDLRGHGESAGERGHVARFADYLDDVDALLAVGLEQDAAFRKSRPGASAAPSRPAFVTHSMGGLVGLEYVLARPQAFRAAALSAPFLGLRLKVPAWKRSLGLAASLIRPGLRLPNELPSSSLSHDPEVCRAYDTDPLVSHEATARWFTEALAAQADVRARASRVKLPVFFMCPGDDHLVDTSVSQQVFDRLGSTDKTLTSYPGLYHEIFNELQKDRVLTDLTNWLDAR